MSGTEDSVSVPEGHNILDLPFAIAYHAATGKTSAVFRSSNGNNHKSYLASTELVKGVWSHPVRISELATRKISSETLAHCYLDNHQQTRFVFRVGWDDTIHMRSEGDANCVWKDHGSITKKGCINDHTKLTATSIPAHGGTILLYHVDEENHLTERWGTKTAKGIEWETDTFTGIHVDVTGQLAVTTVNGKAYIVFTANETPNENIPAECRGALCLVVRDPTSHDCGWGKVHIIAAANQFSVETAVSITSVTDVSHELAICYLGEGSAAWTVQVGLNGAVVPRRDHKGNIRGRERISRLTGCNSLAGTPGVYSGTSILYGMTTLHGTKTLMTFTKVASSECVTTVIEREAVEKWLKIELHERKEEVSILSIQLEITRERAEAKRCARVEIELRLKCLVEEETAAVDEYKLTLAAFYHAETEYSKTITSLTKTTHEVETAKVCRSTSTTTAGWSICGTVKTEIRILDNCGNAIALC